MMMEKKKKKKKRELDMGEEEYVKTYVVKKEKKQDGPILRQVRRCVSKEYEKEKKKTEKKPNRKVDRRSKKWKFGKTVDKKGEEEEEME